MASDFSASARYDITLQAGVRFDEGNMYTIRRIDGVAESLAGWTGECEIRDSLNGTLKLTLITEGTNPGIVLDTYPGSVYMRITHDQTAALELRGNKGVYMLKLISPSLEPTWYLWGKINLISWG